jgi:hypothetical protein
MALKRATCPAGGATTEQVVHTHAVAWSATRPLASARPPHGDSTEHLGCQRPDVQPPAEAGNVETTGHRKGDLQSGEVGISATEHMDGGNG